MSFVNGDVYAFCIIHEDSQHQFNSYTLGDTSGELALSPWNCNKNWYVVIEDESSGGYKWFNDITMTFHVTFYQSALSHGEKY